MEKFRSKILASLISFLLLFYSLSTPGVYTVLAQESSPEPSVEPSPSIEPSPQPSAEPVLEPTPTPEPQLTPEEESVSVETQQPSCPNVSSSPSPSPPPTLTADNTAISENTDNNTVNNSNCADIQTESVGSGTSGENTQSDNEGDVAMQTGDSSGEGALINQGNTNVTAASDDTSQSQASANDSFAEGREAENLNTGEGSENLASAHEEDNLTVNNDNTVVASNEMTVEGTSGENTQDNNEGSTTLTTGDAELIANMLNILNLNITGEDFMHLIINIFGELNQDLALDEIATALGYSSEEELEVIIARNQNVGDDSTNTAVAESEENMTVNNNNEAEVNNSMAVSATSGGNEASNNEGEVDIVTGRIQILANLLNFINTNFTGERWRFIMVNVFGSLAGNIFVPSTDQFLQPEDENDLTVLAENTVAGDAAASSSASSSSNTTVSNDNQVTLTNNVEASAISGENIQNLNGAPAITNSGEVSVITNILNFLNLNITGNNWVFLIVNVFGQWMGQIIGFADSGVIDAPTEGTFAALSVGSGAGVANSDPGSSEASSLGGGSTNTANASYTNNTTVNNTNTAAVNNEMNISGISGQNVVSENEGRASVTTGWIEISANLLNIINMNVTGRNWMIVFLNIFGDFTGNLFFGRPPAPEIASTTTENAPEQEEIIEADGNNVENPENPPNGQPENDTTEISSSLSPTPSPIATPTTTIATRLFKQPPLSGNTVIGAYTQSTDVSSNNQETDPESGSWLNRLALLFYEILDFLSQTFSNFASLFTTVVYGKEVN